MKIIKQFRNDATYLVELDNGASAIMSADEIRNNGGVVGTHDGWHCAIPYNKTNKNGRTYISSSVINEAELLEKVENKMLVGELGHPATSGIESSINRFMVVLLNNASHLITDIKSDDQGFYVKVRTLNTGKGRDLDALPLGSVAFRPRSTGDVNDGVCININIITFDAILKDVDAF